MAVSRYSMYYSSSVSAPRSEKRAPMSPLVDSSPMKRIDVLRRPSEIETSSAVRSRLAATHPAPVTLSYLREPFRLAALVRHLAAR